MSEKLIINESDIVKLIKPKTKLENYILSLPDIKKGLMWGIPRSGHPEGAVVFHIIELFENIERFGYHSDSDKLRLISIVHDAFKYQSYGKIHGTIAREYVEPFIHNSLILDIIQYHDEPYYAWREKFKYQEPRRSEKRMKRFFKLFKGRNLELFYKFFHIDTMTGDKVQAPLDWFNYQIEKYAG